MYWYALYDYHILDALLVEYNQHYLHKSQLVVGYWHLSFQEGQELSGSTQSGKDTAPPHNDTPSVDTSKSSSLNDSPDIKFKFKFKLYNFYYLYFIFLYFLFLFSFFLLVSPVPGVEGTTQKWRPGGVREKERERERKKKMCWCVGVGHELVGEKIGSRKVRLFCSTYQNRAFCNTWTGDNEREHEISSGGRQERRKK